MSGFRQCDIACYHTCSQIRPILPERRHLTLLETLAKHHDALGGEGATATRVHTAEQVAIQAAKDTNYERFQLCDSAQYHTCSESWHTHLSEDTLLCLRASQSAVMPSVVNVPSPY